MALAFGARSRFPDETARKEIHAGADGHIRLPIDEAREANAHERVIVNEQNTLLLRGGWMLSRFRR